MTREQARVEDMDPACLNYTNGTQAGGSRIRGDCNLKKLGKIRCEWKVYMIVCITNESRMYLVHENQRIMVIIVGRYCTPH